MAGALSLTSNNTRTNRSDYHQRNRDGMAHVAWCTATRMPPIGVSLEESIKGRSRGKKGITPCTGAAFYKQFLRRIRPSDLEFPGYGVRIYRQAVMVRKAWILLARRSGFLFVWYVRFLIFESRELQEIHASSSRLYSTPLCRASTTSSWHCFLEDY